MLERPNMLKEVRIESSTSTSSIKKEMNFTSNQSKDNLNPYPGAKNWKYVKVSIATLMYYTILFVAL